MIPVDEPGRIVRVSVGRLSEYVAGAFLVALTMVVSVAVFNRYVLGTSLTWSEPLARYLLVWLAFTGSVVALKHRAHMTVIIFEERLKGRVAALLSLLGNVLLLGLFYYFVRYGIPYALDNATETTVPYIRRDHVLLALPVSAIWMAYYTVKAIIEDVGALR